MDEESLLAAKTLCKLHFYLLLTIKLMRGDKLYILLRIASIKQSIKSAIR